MKQSFIIACVLLFNAAAAQQPGSQEKVSFDSFVLKPGVEWALFNSDGFRFENLNNRLLQRFAAGKITAALPEYWETGRQYLIVCISKDSLDRLKFPVQYRIGVVDSVAAGNSSIQKMQPRSVDTSKQSVTNVNQVLYVENGRLLSFIPWVTASVIEVKSRSGMVLGHSDYFSTCFSYSPSVKKINRSKMHFLATTNREIKLNATADKDKLKETNGRNLVETLWPYIEKDRFKIYAYEPVRNIRASEIGYLKNYTQTPAGSYDSSKNAASINAFSGTGFNPAIFKMAVIEQDWYYDEPANAVFNLVRSLSLYVEPGDGNEKKTAPVIKIVF